MFNLSNPAFLVFKAVLASLLALFLDSILGNPDHVSSTFIAVLCVSPTVLNGLKNAWNQTLGSLVGGFFGGAFLLWGGSIYVSLPLAIGLSIASMFGLKRSAGYPIASFAALFILLVPFGTPLETFGVRFLAIFAAAFSSLCVNILVSSMVYQSIFSKRFQRVYSGVLDILPQVILGDYELADAGFEHIAALYQQLKEGDAELYFRQAEKHQSELKALMKQTRQLNYLLHLVWDFHLLLEESKSSKSQALAFIDWLKNDSQEPMPLCVSERHEIQKRILSAWKTLPKMKGA